VETSQADFGIVYKPDAMMATKVKQVSTFAAIRTAP
jgi:ABC-type molybdate transport system substrate-binding protein